MRYLSLCSGIEAATVAWHPLGWQAEAYSEIEKFPSAVLAHHYPDTPNWGDMTQYKDWPHAAIDVLVGGTPCQSFSVAGLRKGLADPRGNLMLTYLAIAATYQPQWLVWENVPGVLSSNGGRDFGTFLGGLAELGYGFAYRVLDAQYFGLAQRRRRVFVVACAGDWASAAAVLFERHSLQGHPAPSREAGQETTGSVAHGVDEECNASVVKMGPLLRGGQGGTRQTVAVIPRANNVNLKLTVMATGQGGAEINTNRLAPALTCNHEAPILCTHGTQDPCTSDIAFALGRNAGQESVTAIRTANTAIRRLTPKECERLQGFPDDYTQIAWRNKPIDKCPDGPRYKALGNSMAVPVMRWIGERIAALQDIAPTDTKKD